MNATGSALLDYTKQPVQHALVRAGTSADLEACTTDGPSQYVGCRGRSVPVTYGLVGAGGT